MALAAFAVQAPSTASAQAVSTVHGEEIDAEIAGIVGLGMIGVDIGVLLPPMVGLYDHGWAYGVFPALLGGAGVGAGIVLTDKVDRSINITFLTAGLGLFIPALVGSLAWKSNKEDKAMEARRGIFRLGRVDMNAPSLGAAPVYTAEERARFGVAQRTSTRVTLLSGSF